MNIFLNILVPFICLIIGYLMGSANISILLGKMIFKQDPRDYGSHNCGATNCGRLWGKKYFFIVLLFDAFKTVASLFLCWAILTFVKFNGQYLMPTATQMYNADISGFIIQWPVYWMASIGALLGNVFPLFTNFRGGKAVSTYVGIAFVTSWGFTITGAVAFFITLFKSRYVSLSSIITGIVYVISSWTWAILLQCHVLPNNLFWIICYGPLFYCNYVYAIMVTILVSVMIVRHHANIGRLVNGNERKIGWLKSKEKVEN